MDKNTIEQLAIVITDYINNQLNHKVSKRKINAIFHNKSIPTIFSELNRYNTNFKKEKNISTIIVTLAVYIRNLDDQEITKNQIIKYKMSGALFGGLHKMFCGNSRILKIDVDLSDKSLKNKYEYIHRYFDCRNFNLIPCFKCIKTLESIDRAKFECLAYNDQTRLILLNMTNIHMEITPSDDFLKRLIISGDEFKQNIAFYFIVSKLDGLLQKYSSIMEDSEANRKAFREEFHLGMNYINSFIFQCDNKTQTSLLVNYLLQHTKAYPEYFARLLVDNQHQIYFSEQIEKSGKIRNINEVYFITDMIKRTAALNENKRRISKSILYDAVTNLIIDFLDNKRGIYIWEENEQNIFFKLCEILPQKYLRRIMTFTNKKQVTLMCGPLDEMVRFKIFLDDNKTNKILSGVQSIITPFI